LIEVTSDEYGIATLRLAHGKASAMDVELLEALTGTLNDYRDAPAIILTGTGTIFSAGVDLFRLVDEGESYVDRFFPLLSDCIRTLFELPVPVVAATNGHAIAGGCILVCACDYRLMARGNGRIGVPELLVGVPFPDIALKVMQFAVPNVARHVLTGRTYLPDAALAAGMIDEVVAPEQLLEQASRKALELAKIQPVSFALTKRALRGARPDDAAALRVWKDGATHQYIRNYLEKTVKK
jgi:enoyl-CoA hydratase